MADMDFIYGDAIFPREQPSTIRPSSITNPFETGIPSPSGTAPFPTNPNPSPATEAAGIPLTTPNPSHANDAPSSTTSAAAAAAAETSNGPSPTMLVAIIVPIAVVVILIPIGYMLWIRYRTRSMKKLDSEPRYSPSPFKESKYIPQSPPKSEPKPAFLPPLFHDREPTKQGSLFDEVRVSMESARKAESAGMYNHSRDDLGTKDSSYGVYALRRSLEDKGRTDSIGLFDLPRSNERASPATQPQRGPSPTLPSPKVPLFDRPPSEAWPLPAAKLPSPQTLYDPHMNADKPLPAPITPSSMPPPNMPLPRPPGSRHGEQQPNSYASSNLLPSVNHEYRPGTSRSNHGQHAYLQPSHGTNPDLNGAASPTSQYDSPTFSPITPDADRSRNRHRDSDLVSELSYRSPSTERDPKRKSTDAMSIVSAMSHRRRRSDRDADAVSVVSALSPDQEDVPRIPAEHYPRPSR